MSRALFDVSTPLPGSGRPLSGRSDGLSAFVKEFALDIRKGCSACVMMSTGEGSFSDRQDILKLILMGMFTSWSPTAVPYCFVTSRYMVKCQCSFTRTVEMFCSKWTYSKYSEIFGWGAMLQTGRSLVRILLNSLDLLMYLIFPATL
jgi:hypothetical protein